MVKLGVTTLPEFPKDVTDRNRTSPFAFTGNKFEFRAVGSNQSCAGSNTVLNAAFAEALDHITDRLEKSSKNTHDALQTILQDIVKKHKRIIFNGDNYTNDWEKEAEKRGLPNIKKTDESLKAIISKKTIGLMEEYNTLSEIELKARYEINLERYKAAIDIEGKTALDMARTMILPAAIEHQKNLADTIGSLKAAGVSASSVGSLKKELDKASALVSDFIKKADELENSVKKNSTQNIMKSMKEIRVVGDALEDVVADEIWPMPKYLELLFIY